jgi:aspartate dehydrogenase
MKRVLLIGCGAMGRSVMAALLADSRLRFSHILEAPDRCRDLQAELGDEVRVVAALDELDARPDFALECAGHAAITNSVLPLLRQGVDVIVASVGALAEPGLPEKLAEAAAAGGAQLTLVPGAIAAIDALAAASHLRLDRVVYTGRKPAMAWTGTPAEAQVDLRSLAKPHTIFTGNARDAARLYPKNANVAAMIALAGIGFERTEVTLIADPAIVRNTHTMLAQGEFGELEVKVSAAPLADNPKTSALAALSVQRAVRQKLSAVVF